MIDLIVRQVYLFFIVQLSSRRIVHFHVTAQPTEAGAAQQLREATPFGQNLRFLIRERDRKYGDAFARVAQGSSIQILKTPYCAPKANAIGERFLGRVRRECLAPRLILGETHRYRLIKDAERFRFSIQRAHIRGSGKKFRRGLHRRASRNQGERLLRS